jgi:hypothetical protein
MADKPVETDTHAWQGAETQKLSELDTEKAKKKGSIFGDPIFIIE